MPLAKRDSISLFVHFGTNINDRFVIVDPEWALQMRDGRWLDTNYGVEWGWACYNSPFIHEWFHPLLREFVRKFPDVAEIFIDMGTYPNGSYYCSYCLDKAV
ncbi:hypothetical protein ACFPYJ_19275 [Paenibacillus solisilvae]|uniref:Uncharacterized protein n=1 Tax=Paenibacillus solisilvae TaxID=2486751 RepID=A0ABW0VZ74_9BACL